jgi:hypothetical protein
MPDFQENFLKSGNTYTIAPDTKLIQIIVKLSEKCLELF